MTVYIDTMKQKYGRMIMSHMLADTSDELMAMAEKIGVNKKWLQDQGTYREHFDICQAKRKLAIAAGAIEISTHELGSLLHKKNGGCVNCKGKGTLLVKYPGPKFGKRKCPICNGTGKFQ
ncbi:MAG: DUF4031 domain-containing protein [Alphaproteobacteria bacterium]